jgi:hypothetical protein
MNIYEKLLKITEELGYVAKNLSVGNQYKAVGEGDVLAAVKPLEIKHGVYSHPLSREIVFQDVLEEDKGTYTKTTFFMRVKTTYRFVNVDLPSEFVDIDTFGDGVDSLDKAPGKAMTYADKYALLKAYKIQTGDDPDQHHSKDTQVKKVKGLSGAKITMPQIDKIQQLIKEKKIDSDRMKKFYKVATIQELNYVQAEQIIKGKESK